MFEERPIWSKNAIVTQVECHPEQLKSLLPTVAYYFLTGPWRALWVRFDYDPRKHPSAVKYQLLDFRLRQGECVEKKHMLSCFGHNPNLSFLGCHRILLKFLLGLHQCESSQRLIQDVKSVTFFAAWNVIPLFLRLSDWKDAFQIIWLLYKLLWPLKDA